MTEINKTVLNALADVLHKKKLQEIEYETETFRIKIVGEQANTAAPIIIPQAGAPSLAPVSQNTANTAVVAKELDEKDMIRSPLVGVIFMSPEPGANPFIEEGKSVKKGDTLCLVEAMKTFNPLKAPRSGKISKIFVEDGQPIEFDEILFSLE
ncbi:MAG: acetyl-CoA carboxylase biotin carboxyl carrier protein [Alphaproteobacteria bacterium]|nr:acetyl-CoA carboxylase biotin carboxyl carrier protein [Alphaproteobacteria bacterium]